MWDEMKIKEGLVFNKHSCQLIGFVDCGDINHIFDELEHKSLSSNKQQMNKQKMATHMLVFMVRGIFSYLSFPYAQFPTNGVSSGELCSLVWEAVYNLEISGFKVVAFTCDGASCNRKFFRMHGFESGSYKTKNPYSDDPSRKVYFFSDVPHLIKTVRNCFANSFGHSHVRALWVSSN